MTRLSEVDNSKFFQTQRIAMEGDDHEKIGVKVTGNEELK